MNCPSCDKELIDENGIDYLEQRCHCAPFIVWRSYQIRYTYVGGLPPPHKYGLSVFNNSPYGTTVGDKPEFLGSHAIYDGSYLRHSWALIDDHIVSIEIANSKQSISICSITQDDEKHHVMRKDASIVLDDAVTRDTDLKSLYKKYLRLTSFA